MAKMLETLTQEQEKLIEDTKDWWIQYILYSGDEVKEDEAIKGAEWLYEFCGFKKPEVHIVDSPMACQKKANDIAGNKDFQFYNYAYESLGQSCGWTAYVDMFTKLGVIQDDNFEKYKSFLLSGVFMSIFLEGYAILCRRPKAVKLNETGQLHSVDSPAIEWRDGYKLYFLNGVPVTEEIVMTHSTRLDPMLVVRERNAEVRREIVRKIGIERVIQKLGGNTIDTYKGRYGDLDYKLVTLSIDGMNTKPIYLVMKNPSLGTWHAEGVPPNIRTCKEALAWRDGDEGEYVDPDIIT
jgi:hypothetical protein